MSVFNTKKLKTEINTIMLNKTDSSNTPSENSLTKLDMSIKRDSKKKPEDLVQRPYTLDDLVQSDKLTEDTNVETTIVYNDCNEDEEFWIVDIPKTINPLQLKGKSLQLGDKSNFKIGKDKYCAKSKESNTSLTCVFGKSKTDICKIVNIRPSGAVSIRRKLSAISRNKVPYEKSETVPFPKNVKLRHPLFGVQFVNQ